MRYWRERGDDDTCRASITSLRSAARNIDLYVRTLNNSDPAAGRRHGRSPLYPAADWVLSAGLRLTDGRAPSDSTQADVA
jgi:hypothetical protein